MKKEVELWILHGWAKSPNNREKWQYLIDLLAKNGVKAIFLEIPGLDTDLEEAWTLEDFVQWLGSVLPAESVNLLGHSFGGQLAVKFSVDNSERINNLILIGPSGIRDNAFLPAFKRNFFRIIAIIGKVFTRSASLRKFLYKLAREKDYLSADPNLRQTMKSILQSEILDDIPKIESPTLLLWGKNDKASPFKFSQYYREQIESIVFHEFENARHSPQFTEPEKTAQIISDFLKAEK